MGYQQREMARALCVPKAEDTTQYPDKGDEEGKVTVNNKDSNRSVRINIGDAEGQETEVDLATGY